MHCVINYQRNLNLVVLVSTNVWCCSYSQGVRCSISGSLVVFTVLFWNSSKNYSAKAAFSVSWVSQVETHKHDLFRTDGFLFIRFAGRRLGEWDSPFAVLGHLLLISGVKPNDVLQSPNLPPSFTSLLASFIRLVRLSLSHFVSFFYERLKLL